MNRQNTKTMLPVCCVGVMVSWGMVIILCSIGALCIINEYISFGAVTYVSSAIQLISVFCGTFIAGKMGEKNRILNCCIVAMACLVSSVIIALLLFDGAGSGLIVGLVLHLLGGLAGILATGARKKRLTQTRKRRGSR